MKLKDECVVLVLLHLAAVLDALGLRISMTSLTKVVNDETFIVVCRDDNGLPITWSGPRGLLGPKTQPAVDTKSYGTSIIFNGSRTEDSGTYTCSNTMEEAQFHLTVEPRLKFSDTAVNQTAKEGQEFLVKCEVKDGAVSWLLEGVIIEDSDKYQVLGDGLLIRNVGPSDSRTYTCKAVQTATGIVLDRQIHLHVKHKPVHPVHKSKRITQEVAWGYVNGDVNLTCNVLANPPAKFEWQKSNDTKKKTGRVRNQADNLSILQLHVDNSTFGDYKCIARNEFGTYERWFKLERGDKPHPPKNLKLDSMSAETLTVQIIEADTTSRIPAKTVGFSVRYKKNDEDAAWQYQEFNSTRDNLYTLINLDPNTEYQIEAATRNMAGLGDYAALARLRTSTASGCSSWLLPIVSLGVFARAV